MEKSWNTYDYQGGIDFQKYLIPEKSSNSHNYHKLYYRITNAIVKQDCFQFG